jgi:hypothetical protein
VNTQHDKPCKAKIVKGLVSQALFPEINAQRQSFILRFYYKINEDFI